MLPFEDQLDRDERVRVEALTLAIQFVGAQKGPRHKSATEQANETIATIAAPVHELADEFRKYIEDGLPAPEEDDEDADE